MKITKTKKVLSLLLSVIMLLGVIPAGMMTASASDSDVLTISTSGGEARVLYCSISASGDVIIPDKYNDCPVTEIVVGAFLNCNKVRNVYIPDTVEEIGNRAFAGCTLLEKVTIGKGVTKIGSGVFEDCSSLDRISVADGNTVYSSDSDGVLYNKAKTEILLYPVANSATTYTVSDKVEKIADSTFFMSQKVKTIVIGDNVKEIGHNAFMGSRSLESVKLGKGVERILGNQAFSDCEKLTSITVASGNTVYSSDSDGILYNKDKTEIIKYPEGISKTAFTVPTGIKAIRTNSFRNAVNLKTVSFPKSLEAIDASAFTGCTAITDVSYAGKEDEWNKITIGNDNNAILSAKISFAGGEAHDHKYTATVTKAATCSESGVKTFKCTCGHSYTEPIAPSGHVFKDNECTSCKVQEFVLASDGTYAKITAYNGVGGAVVIPEKIEGYTINAIGDSAFENKTAVTSITLPSNIIEIGNNAFFKTGYYNTASNWDGKVLYIGKYLIEAKDTLGSSYTVKDGTEVIAEYAFASAKSLASITLPAETIYIGDYAFSGCTALAAVTVNATEDEWKNAAVIGTGNTYFRNATFNFKYVPHVHNFVVTEEVAATCTTAGYRKSKCDCGEAKDEVLTATGHIFVSNVCSGCGERQFNISISGDTATILGCHASLSGVVTVPATIGGYKVTAIGEKAFYNNGKIEKLILPAGVEVIGNEAFTASGIVVEFATGNTHFLTSDGVVYNNAKTELVYCPASKAAKELTVPSDVNKIADGAFYGASAIETIKLPRTLKEIGKDAFSGCTAIKEVIFEGTRTEWKAVAIAEGNEAFLKAIFTYNDASDVNDAEEMAKNLLVINATVRNQNTEIIITADEGKDEIIVARVDKNNKEVIVTTTDTLVDTNESDYTLSFNNWHKSGNKTETDITVDGKTFTVKFVFAVDAETQGHIYDIENPEILTATCTTYGGKRIHCTICDHYYDEPDVNAPALGHSFGSWTIEEDETCSKPGKKQRVCSRCGLVEEGTVPPSGVHAYKSEVTAPTCTEKGYTTFTCDCGDTYRGNEVPAKGHDFDVTVTKAAECEATGESTHKCKVCYFTKTEVIPATGHKYEGTVFAPTYSSQGYTEYKCVNEGCPATYRDNFVPALASVTSVSIQDIVVYKDKTYPINPNPACNGEPKWTAKYKIQDESIISIDEKGEIKGLKKGKTTVECTITDEAGNEVKDTFTVEVKLTVWQWIVWFFVDFIYGGLKDFFSTAI